MCDRDATISWSKVCNSKTNVCIGFWFTITVFQSLLTMCFAETTAKGFWTDSSKGQCKRTELAGRAAGLGGDAHPLDWLNQSCPIEEVYYSCYFLGDVRRAEVLEERVWMSADGECLDFDPQAFLQTVQGRRVFFFGDSVMGQIVFSLFCALFPLQIDLTLDYEWVEWKTDSGVCLYGSEHCHIQLRDPYDIVAESRSHDFALFYKVSHNRRERFFDTLKVMRFEASDILIFNFGLCDNVEKPYEHLLSSLLEELKLIKLNESVVLPSLFFLESTPQHFRTPTGYYNSSADEEFPCTPMADIASARQNDWRNLHAHTILGGHEETLGRLSL